MKKTRPILWSHFPIGAAGMGKVLSHFYRLKYPCFASIVVHPYYWNNRTRWSVQSQKEHYEYLLTIFEEPASDLYIEIVEDLELFEAVGKKVLIADGKNYDEPDFNEAILPWKLHTEVYWPIKLKYEPTNLITAGFNPAVFTDFTVEDLHPEDRSHINGKKTSFINFVDLQNLCKEYNVDFEWTGYHLPIQEAMEQVMSSTHFTYPGMWCWFLTNAKAPFYIFRNKDTTEKYDTAQYIDSMWQLPNTIFKKRQLSY